MADKVRVMFNIPRSHPKWSKLARPVEIPLEEYIQFRIDEQTGSKDYMASYVTRKYLKGDGVSADEIKMVTAPGNYIHTFELDRLIEQGINPLERMNQDDEEDEDDDYFTIPKGYGDDDDDDDDNPDNLIHGNHYHAKNKKQNVEENQKWNKNATIAVLILIAFLALLVILLISFI